MKRWQGVAYRASDGYFYTNLNAKFIAEHESEVDDIPVTLLPTAELAALEAKAKIADWLAGAHCDDVCRDAADVIVVANRVGVDWRARIKTLRPRGYKVSKLRNEEAIA